MFKRKRPHAPLVLRIGTYDRLGRSAECYWWPRSVMDGA